MSPDNVQLDNENDVTTARPLKHTSRNARRTTSIIEFISTVRQVFDCDNSDKGLLKCFNSNSHVPDISHNISDTMDIDDETAVVDVTCSTSSEEQNV
jgi:hypothetical protein